MLAKRKFISYNFYPRNIGCINMQIKKEKKIHKNNYFQTMYVPQLQQKLTKKIALTYEQLNLT